MNPDVPNLNHIQTKNSIQAYLKNREAKTFESTVSSAISDLHLSDDSIHQLPLSNDLNAQDSNSADLSNQQDFNYSQKLFHISDGNLYSVFSPLEGRSYGMKPSFLRKQKYTVQECNSRGRRNVRKGLKFHNFIPSESVTSEKDSSLLQNKWKVHSECRLKEEHGTKQITISNWSQSLSRAPRPSDGHSVNHPQPVQSSSNDPSSSQQETASSTHIDPYAFTFQNNYSFPGASKECSTTVSKHRDPQRSCASKKDSLDFVLNSLHDRPAASVIVKSVCDHGPKSSYDNPKHRRKPVQTRRVVPYNKYLSIMEEKDDILPLDLSSKYSAEAKPDDSGSDDSSSGNESAISYSQNCIHREEKDSSVLSAPSSHTKDMFANSSLASLLQSRIPPSLMLSAPSTSKTEPCQDSMKSVNPLKFKPPLYPVHQMTHPLMLSKQFVPNKPPKLRRRNQRSVIKQKLEDTFRQNGFLVKTKQVSDGEATFCKFRQLRKYTRYYLKSWQQHLPDEVHKMWKGFLPPKSVLPTVSDADSEIANDEPFEST